MHVLETGFDSRRAAIQSIPPGGPALPDWCKVRAREDGQAIRLGLHPYAVRTPLVLHGQHVLKRLSLIYVGFLETGS